MNISTSKTIVVMGMCGRNFLRVKNRNQWENNRTIRFYLLGKHDFKTGERQ
jgi:hypothetical protein